MLLPLIWLGVHDGPAAWRRRAARSPGGLRWGAEIGDALRTRAFWALFFAYLCTPLAVFSVVTHQVAFAVDHGFPRLFVASIFGLTGLLSVVGRIGFGIAADRIGRATSATISYGCTAVGTLCLLGLEVSAARGRALRLRDLLRPRLRRARPHHHRDGLPALSGALRRHLRSSSASATASAAASRRGSAGFVHDLTGSYRIAFLIAVGFCAVGAACFWLARPPRDAL